VGLGMQPPQFLKLGDRLRAGIDGLGEQAHAITLLAR
jgi:2,4-didehydro-3-deoxy-L-rhamnonate hydrolase